MRGLVITQSTTNRQDGVDGYLRELNNIPMIPVEEEVKVAELAATGDLDAINKLVESNLRFVVSVAKQYQGIGKLSLSDLINEGNMGLMMAARKYDPTRGVKFISYAVWWIRQHIMGAIDNVGDLVRIPVNRKREMLRMRKDLMFLEQEHQRAPSEEEMMEFTGYEREVVSLYSSDIDKSTSMDAPIADDATETRGSMMVGENTADGSLMRESLKKDVAMVLNILEDSDRVVVSKYFGLNGFAEHSVSDISEELDMGKERVRQIKRRALSQLKKRSHSLKGYL